MKHMKRTSIVLSAIVFVFGVQTCVADNDGTVKHTLPGTGLSVTLPTGITPGPLGTYFTDEAGSITVVVLAGPASFNLENDRTYRTIFPDPPEKVEGRHLSGNLYRRTRSQHGGAWDGWWLSAIRGSAVLNVQAMYTAQSGEEFEKLKAMFSSIVWKESEVDSELAFGMTTSVPNRHVVRSGFGPLSFTKDGQPGGSGHSLLLQVMPVASGQGKLVVPAACASGFEAAFQGESYSGPNEIEQDGIVACDAWSSAASGEPRYMAMLLMPNGAVVSAIGKGDPLQFRSSVLKLHATR